MKTAVSRFLAVLALVFWGLALLHCGNGGPECESDADCVQKRGAGWICNLATEKCVECIPNCAGKCCGDDGCNGTCEDNCADGTECNTANCQCETTPECDDDQTCINLYGANYTCNLTTGTCECTPGCSGKCCGDDGCGGTCQDNCTGTCNTTSCECEVIPCTGDGDCPNPTTECCKNDACTPMNCTGRVCGNDTECGTKSCGTCPAGQTCNLSGQCETAPFEGECPTGQQCTDLTSDGSGYYGCVEPPMTVPAGNQTGCDPWEAGIYCDGNYTCVPSTPENVCIENCGNCAAGLECVDMVDGYRGCMTTDGDIPVDAPICGSGNPCVGNATCWIFTYGDGTQRYACIANCNLGYGCTTENETRCVGDTVQTCTGGTWVETTDCTASSQFCDSNTGACIAPPGEGDFCDNTGYQCAAGLECVGFQGYDNAFCTPTCDCTNNTGCSAGWECLIPDADPPTQCWCMAMCPGQSVSECPNGGTGWTCEVVGNDGTNDIYGCMP